MSKNKKYKRKREHVDAEISSLPSSSNKRSRNLAFHAGKAPQIDVPHFESTPSQVPRYQFRGGRDIRPPGNIDMSQSLPFNKAENTQVTKHNGIQSPTVSTSGSVSQLHLTTTPHRQLSQNPHHTRSSSESVKIKPPQDHLQAFMTAIEAQNRHRSGRHQTFTAKIHSDTDSDIEILSSVKASDDDSKNIDKTNSNGGKNDVAAPESSLSQALSSDEKKSSSSSSDSDSDSSEEPETTNKVSNSKVKPAIMGRELVEEMKRTEKERVEQAAKKAVSKIKAVNPPNNTQDTTVTLTKPEQAALKSLQVLIPPHIVTQTYHKLKTGKPPGSQPSDLTLTLQTARNLIIHLSASSIVKDTNTDPGDTNMQAELLRISKDREQRVCGLESVVKRLEAEAKATAEDEVGDSKGDGDEEKRQKKKERKDKKRKRKGEKRRI